MGSLSMSLNFAFPRVVAHRGESGFAPENTLAAFTLAADNGATWVELDANISADQVPYVHHDSTLDRCTNGTGHLSEQNSISLDKLDAGSWFDKRFIGEPLPSLTAVIQLLRERQMGLNLEIKPSRGLDESTTDAVCLTVNQNWPEDLPLIISSFSEKALLRTKQKLPQANCGYLVGAVPEDWRERMRTLNCKTLHCSANNLNQVTATAVKEAGYGLLCYTVNDLSVARRLWSWGVDSVFSDYPSALISAQYS